MTEDADLRRAILERDQARWMVAHLKASLKAMRRDLRQTRAELRSAKQSLVRGLVGEAPEKNPPG